jgi:hypothetical protein
VTDVRIVPLAEFVSVDEPSAEPLIGEKRETVLPAGGRLLMYGDGGAGKTTFTIDAIAHLAAGVSWMGLHVARPLRVLIVENEGPRGMFREKLDEKIIDWDGPPFHDNVDVLEEPWAAFTFADLTVTGPAATHIEQREIDVLVAGPLASLGTIGGGTPAEVQAFVRLLDAMKATVGCQYAEWLIHHENKAGAVSGAWDRVPDTLVHVQGQGNGRTRVHWAKVRHSSALHDTSTNLVWSTGKSFAVEDSKARDLHAELLQALHKPNEFNGWHTAREAATAIKANVDKVKEALSELVEAGDLEHQKGPVGRKSHALCWRPATDSDDPSQFESVTPLEGFAQPTDSPTPPEKESVSESVELEAGETDSTDPSQFNGVAA